MNSESLIRQKIEDDFKTFDKLHLRDASTRLLNTLGYYSRRVGNDSLDKDRFKRLNSAAKQYKNPREKLRNDEWQSFHYVMQVTDDEVNKNRNQFSLFSSIEYKEINSYLFVAVKLSGDGYTRTTLSNITRFINTNINENNKENRLPVLVMFRYGDFLTLAIIDRRDHKIDKNKKVLEKVTLIKDMNLYNLNAAHRNILSDIWLEKLIEKKKVKNFKTLHQAWSDILDTEPLNRNFYNELYKWYEWAKTECNFPDNDNGMQIIRMITRLLFIWFLKEKKLVPENIFNIENTSTLLNNFSMDSSDYYQAVLQNLFFATLNTPIGDRKFSTRDHRNHRDASKYRYEDLLQDSSGFLKHLKQVPFVNGGLFDCLDPFESTGDGGERPDCFSDNQIVRSNLHVPAKLFFDTNDGIFTLFNRYKFTVEENTPVEQEVALDPELLGQVFENLLGVYNPETRSTARRATGSYYTPRKIVDYMVDEALIAYFIQKVVPHDEDLNFFEIRLREDLLAYDKLGEKNKSNEHLIYDSEIEPIIDAINDLKIIDPAVGTGAFPMAILNKLVLILRKLDPQNKHWKQRQLMLAEKFDDTESKERAIKGIEDVFSKENRYNDYGRKLYLIKNCIYGVDIQPVAITIAKLRFFITLIIEQDKNDRLDSNHGIRPLPNLEAKFVAANTLIGLKEIMDPQFQLFLENEDIDSLRQEIAILRGKHFSANTRYIKKRFKDAEKECRRRLTKALNAKYDEWRDLIENRIEQQIENSQLSTEKAIQGLREELYSEYTAHKAILKTAVSEAERIAQWDAYDQHSVADFFEPEWMFNVKDGFDIVIGNPPYIRHEKITHLKPALQKHFEEFFASTADISVYFYKRAAELLRDGSTLTYICTNKFLRSEYGENLRQFLTTEMSPQILLDLGNVPIFKAAVDTCITCIKRDIPKDKHTIQALTLRKASDDLNISDVFQKKLFPIKLASLSSDVWAIAPPNAQNLLKKLKNTGKPFKEIIQGEFYFGIKTGYNEAYIIDANTRELLIGADAGSCELIRPLLRGKNLRRWNAETDNEYLIVLKSSANKKWDWSNASNTQDAERIFKKVYPAIFDYLSRFQEKLVDRADQGVFYWELRSCSYYSVFEKPKFIYPDISSLMRASYDTEGVFGEATTFCIPSRDFSLLAILNSQLFDWYARYKFQTLKDPWAGGGLRFKTIYMQHVPIADRTEEQKAQLSELVEQILEDPKSEKVHDLEKDIDEIVYRLYGLSRSEISLIEQTYRDAEFEV